MLSASRIHGDRERKPKATALITERNLQPSTLNVDCKIKINLSNRFKMIWCSPEASGRSAARNATRKQRLKCAMLWLSVSRFACITMVSLDWSFVTESSSEKRLSPRYSNLAFYDLWQYRPRFQQNNQTLRRPSNSSPNKMTEAWNLLIFPTMPWAVAHISADFNSYLSDMGDLHHKKKNKDVK